MCVPGRAWALLGVAIVATAGCGARTGLPIPDASRDAGIDARPDAPRCTDEPVRLALRRAQVMFVIDRSTSMGESLEGDEPGPGEATRWELLQRALAETLVGSEEAMLIGADLYPQASPDVPNPSPERACGIDDGIDLSPGPSNTRPLLDLLAAATPRGGTPTAAAIAQVRDYLLGRAEREVPQFIVLATDGAPNCNPDTGVPASECVCTATREHCRDPVFGPYNCLDDERALREIDEAFSGHGIPVYVVGIPNPTRPDLVAVLDQMAVAGGRPRPVDEGDRFYSIRRPADLERAFETIADSIARCVYVTHARPAADQNVQVEIDGRRVSRDRERAEGWDWTDRESGELTFFGPACDRASSPDAEIQAHVPCPDGG